MSDQAITPTKLPRHKSDRHQSGYVYEASNAFHVRYYTTEIVDGKSKRVQRSKWLCTKDRNTGHGSKTAKAVQMLAADHMRTINAPSRVITGDDCKIVDFYTNRYLPRIQTRLKPSTLRGYKQVWEQHLKGHFAGLTLQGYESKLGQRFLQSLTDTQNRTTLKHIKAVAGAIFKRAKLDEIIPSNPWRDVEIPEDAKEPANTPHYTMEQAEDMITALVEHVDGQLVIALAFFLGLGPAEISGLQWGDIDNESISIRRNKVTNCGVGSPKTPSRIASVPLIGQVRIPLLLWRAKSQDVSDGAWVIPDLHNLTERVIKPCVRKSGCKWHGLYAGRRGACTAVIEATNGNYAVAQALLRHKSMTTTLNVYKKAITKGAFQTGMKQLEASLSK